METTDLEGGRPESCGRPELDEEIERAYDYRGDVSVDLTDGTTRVGYLFNRDRKAREPYVELFDEAGRGPIALPFREIAGIRLTGRDTAAGKSYQAWKERQEESGAWTEPAPDIRARMAILVALEQELSALPIEGREQLTGRAVRGTLAGVPIVAAATGMGREAACVSARELLRHLKVRAVLCLGFAGGLRSDLSPGTLVLGTRLRAHGSGEKPDPLEGSPLLAGRAIDALAAGAVRFRAGECLTLRRIARTAEEKRWLADSNGALAVDLESYWMAREAAALGLPWVVCRSVVDPVALTLPAFVAGEGPGGWMLPAVRHALSSWRGAGELVSLARAAQRARSALARAAVALAPALAGTDREEEP